MNEWASSPWANDNNASSSIGHLSPVPPSFAKTSPTLDSGYFNTGFTDEAAWGDGATPTAPGLNSFDDGIIGGALGSGAWAGLQSPRPIASPGRIANGKGNRWLRPASLQEVNDLGKSADAVARTEVESEEAGLAEPSAVNVVKSVDEAMEIEDNPFRSTEEARTDGLGIALEDLDVPQGPVVHEAQDDLKNEVEFDNVQPPAPRPFPESPHWRAVEDGSNTPEPAQSEAKEAIGPASSPEPLESSHEDTHVTPVATPSVDFPVDLTLLTKVFPPMGSEINEDLPLLDTIITTSSARKTHYRITRPYSLRQYNLGNFENYSRIAWSASAIHEQAVKHVAAWIAKDRASGGGVFDVPSVKRRSGFGWGSDNEKVSDQKPTVSASSIMLPKIVGPSGAFGWSSAAMTPLQPMRAGEEAPKASTEVADMQPRPRRTPIRKPRAVSNKIAGSHPVVKSASPAMFDEFDVFEKAEVPAHDQTHSDSQQAADGTPHEPGTGLTDDLGIFEDATDDFQDFVIAPPPSRPSTVPPMDVLDNAVNVEDELENKEIHTLAEEGEIHDADNTIIQNHEDNQPQVRPYAQDTSSAAPIGLMLDDLSMSAGSTATKLLNTKSPEKEFLFAGHEDEFDDFEPFESAPALTFSDDSPDGDASYIEHDRNDSVSLPAKHRDDVGLANDDVSAFDVIKASATLAYVSYQDDGSKPKIEVNSDNFNDFDAFESTHPAKSMDAGPSSVSQHGENNRDLDMVRSVEHEDQTIAEDADQDSALKHVHTPGPNEPVHHASSEHHPEPKIEHSQGTENPRAETVTSTPEDIMAAPITSAPAPLNDMIYDDFSIFESQPTISQQPPATISKPPYPISVMTGQIDHPTIPTLSLPHPLALSKSSDHGPIIQQQAPTSNTINNDEDDDDFGAFEEAISPIIQQKHQSLDSRLQEPPSQHIDIDAFFSQQRPVSTPLPARHDAQVTIQEQSTSTLSPLASSIPSVPHSQTQPENEIQILRPTAPAPQSSNQTAPALLPKETTATNPTNPANPVSNPSKPTKVKDNNTGASILNILAFLDEADAGNDDDDDADANVGREVEALAGEKVIKRLAREEWIGEKPTVVGNGGERQKANGAGGVDEPVVQEVVRGLPDWGFMLD